MDSSQLTICITGAAGHIASAFYVLLGSGHVFGSRVSFKLNLLELPEKLNELKGIKMQIEDCAFSLIKSIEVTDDPAVAFKDIDVGIFLGGFPRKPGMERQDLLQINNEIFKAQGQLLDLHAKPTARILVVANPSNTNCLTLAEACHKIPRKNFTSLMQLDVNRARNMVIDNVYLIKLAIKANVSVEQVQRLIVWGNHSQTQYPDITHATINGQSLKEVITDNDFLNGEFLTMVQKRGSQILQVSKTTSYLSAANAVKDHMNYWYQGTPEGVWTSMGVINETEKYGIPKDICFAMPVRCKNFDYEVVEGLTINEYVKKRLDLSLKELLNEREEAHIE